MLYTFSQSTYNTEELAGYLNQITSQDALVLWQDAVLLPLKHPQLFNNLNVPVMLLQIDVEARNLTEKLASTLANSQLISLQELVNVTTQFHPQFAL
ncbi:spermidine/putrescine ABC transporter substrate-binding protein [Canicola haemoglobinophilus]|uniref:Sulfur relay protein TusB/DsrH n=1 Tax=Canicola haemoglobinophilus TaxID=733 RepID=A0A1V4AYU3_9PAST|nr:DsrH/TusB family sulfur metabolism protein [Canicola haemoglobinophilus]OOR97221.1 spermidine/putrescine ABC transporter substrate-binding protein [Canicola haemoglobinophilus]STO55313.1 sulfur relay protein TusB/DsrH [Canicola haemoglobinophilus]STO59380.1 sulfur relay protein TusB/DsrH [Canicola haemoglobinophilus]STO69117.1 sulfur relay protein TusB/DsrH [Canicola haemoglobinophilus]